ncbi:MAG: DUF4386 domain-containing protein [Terracidiphilus sp.]
MTDERVEEMAVESQAAARNRLARWTGAVYLAFIVLFATCSTVQGRIVSSDPAATARTIQHSMMLFRAAFLGEIVSALLFFSAAWCLYLLLKPVGRGLAVLLMLLNLAGVAAECAATSLRFGALQWLASGDPLRGFTSDQAQAMAMLIEHVGGAGMIVATLFYGAWLYPLGWLVYKSGFIPRFWGVLLLADAVSMTICFVQQGFFPACAKWTYPLYPIMFVAEAGTALWLLVKGASTKPSRPLTTDH